MTPGDRSAPLQSQPPTPMSDPSQDLSVKVAEGLDAETRAFYMRAMDLLDGSGVAYCVGGAYGLAHYAGIVRHTKDLDVFLRAEDLPRVLKLFESSGYATELTHPHWVAKAFSGEGDAPAVGGATRGGAFVDFIFRSGNGLWPVDREWLDHVVPGRVLGRPGPLCPAEEMILSKSFVMARERFDGADINHVLRAAARNSTGSACCAATPVTSGCCWGTWSSSATSTQPSGRACRSG